MARELKDDMAHGPVIYVDHDMSWAADLDWEANWNELFGRMPPNPNGYSAHLTTDSVSYQGPDTGIVAFYDPKNGLVMSSFSVTIEEVQDGMPARRRRSCEEFVYEDIHYIHPITKVAMGAKRVVGHSWACDMQWEKENIEKVTQNKP